MSSCSAAMSQTSLKPAEIIIAFLIPFLPHSIKLAVTNFAGIANTATSGILGIFDIEL